MNERDRIRLIHMRDAAQEAIHFAGNESRESLTTNRKSLWAIVKAIEIIGEAAARMSEESQRAYPQIPWAQIVGMRNRLIHAYFDIEVETVWQTVKHDLPPLLAELQDILTTPHDTKDD